MPKKTTIASNITGSKSTGETHEKPVHFNMCNFRSHFRCGIICVTLQAGEPTGYTPAVVKSVAVPAVKNPPAGKHQPA
jgi:hypothetical protein